MGVCVRVALPHSLEGQQREVNLRVTLPSGLDGLLRIIVITRRYDIGNKTWYPHNLLYDTRPGNYHSVKKCKDRVSIPFNYLKIRIVSGINSSMSIRCCIYTDTHYVCFPW